MSVKEFMRYKRDITPALAARMLEKQEEKLAELDLIQRVLRAAKVTNYAEKMQRGDWHWGIHSIHLASNGAVLNGQHTLHAIVQSGVTVTEDVWENTPPSYFSAFDTQGSQRSLDDVLKIQGEEHSALLAQVLPKIVAYNRGILGSFTVKALPTEELLETLAKEKDDIQEAVSFGLTSEFRDSVVAFMYYAYARAGLLEEVLPFLKGFRDGANLKAASVPLRFRNWVISQGRNLREKKLYAVFFKALNASIAGTPIGNFGALPKKPVLRPMDAE